MPDILKPRRGQKETINKLKDGELAITTDTKEIFLGSENGNIPIYTPTIGLNTYIDNFNHIRIQVISSINADLLLNLINDEYVKITLESYRNYKSWSRQSNDDISDYYGVSNTKVENVQSDFITLNETQLNELTLKGQFPRNLKTLMEHSDLVETQKIYHKDDGYRVLPRLNISFDFRIFLESILYYKYIENDELKLEVRPLNDGIYTTTYSVIILNNSGEENNLFVKIADKVGHNKRFIKSLLGNDNKHGNLKIQNPSSVYNRLSRYNDHTNFEATVYKRFFRYAAYFNGKKAIGNEFSIQCGTREIEPGDIDGNIADIILIGVKR